MYSDKVVLNRLFPGINGIWKCWFLWMNEKGRVKRIRTTILRGERREPTTQPCYNAEANTPTRDLQVGGKCSHRCCSIPHVSVIFR